MPKPFDLPRRVVEETGAFIPEQQAYLAVVRTAEVLSGELAALMAEHGLSGKQYNVLRALRRRGRRADRVRHRGGDDGPAGGRNASP